MMEDTYRCIDCEVLLLTQRKLLCQQCETYYTYEENIR